jgi:hypothetical protein
VAPTIIKSPGGSSDIPSPIFGWGQVEPGATFSWQVLAPGNKIIQGPISTATTEATVGPLGLGAYAFQVRQIDAAGNVGPFSAAEPFNVTTTAAGSTPGVSTNLVPGTGAGPGLVPIAPGRTVPSTQNVKALTPKKGTKITTLRPRVSWKRVRGAKLYNLQFFRVSGTRLIKVHKAFPTGTTYRVPPKKLKAGWRVVWRVWPFLTAKNDYSKQPLGVSFFDVGATARK